jgi:hypothetical protein
MPLSSFPPDAQRKLDAKLNGRLRRGDDPIEVAVTFVGAPPADDVLAALGLTRMNDMVFGRVAVSQIAQIAQRHDVTWIEAAGTVELPKLPFMEDGEPLKVEGLEEALSGMKCPDDE